MIRVRRASDLTVWNSELDTFVPVSLKGCYRLKNRSLRHRRALDESIYDIDNQLTRRFIKVKVFRTVHVEAKSEPLTQLHLSIWDRCRVIVLALLTKSNATGQLDI